MSDRLEERPTPQPMSFRGRLVILAVALVAVPLSLLPLRPPPVQSASAPPSEFSADRAWEHVVVIAAEPHSVGTPANERVRDYLVAQLRDAGLEPEVQRGLVSRDRGVGRLSSVAVENVLARLPGTVSEAGAIVLVAHYDSVQEAPGAADNAAAVAALLETLRALQTGPPLERDVLFLFTDGEEEGLVGAQVFLHDSPWADRAALVLNFEARGGGGPSIMFETGPGTGPLLGEFAQATPRPVAASYSEDVYRLLPNNTDFTLFEERGIPGFNFAFIFDQVAYHSPLDNLQRLSRRSLQHHGSHALSLSRAFGSGSWEAGGTPRVYFNAPLMGLIHYPQWLEVLLVALLALVTVGVLTVGVRTGRIPVGATLLRFLLLLAAPVLAAVAGLLLGSVLPKQGIGDGTLYLAGWGFAGLAVTALLCELSKRRLHGLVAASLLLWATLCVTVVLLLPGSSFLFSWPLLVLLLATAPELAGRRSLWLTSGRGEAGLALGTLVLLVIWVPVLFLMGKALGPETAAISAFLGSLAGLALVPQLALLGPRRRRVPIPAAMFGIAALVIVAGLGLGGHESTGDGTSSLIYVWDGAREEGLWTTLDLELDEHVGQVIPVGSPQRELPELFEGYPLESYVAPAPDVPLPLPEVRLVERRRQEGRQTLALAVESRRQAAHLNVEFESRANLLVTSLNGEPVTPPANGEKPDFWTLRLFGNPPGGHRVEVQLPVGEDLSWNVVDRTPSLPPSLAETIEASPGVPPNWMTMVRSAGEIAPDSSTGPGLGEAAQEPPTAPEEP